MTARPSMNPGSTSSKATAATPPRFHPHPPQPQRPHPRIPNSSLCAAPPAASRRTWRLAVDPAGHLAAHHRRQGDGRKPPHHQSAPHAGRPQQGFLHAPDRLGHRQARSKTIPDPQPCLRREGRPAFPRCRSPQINLGIAVDVAGKDGARSLLVPNIKNAGALNFQEYRRPPSTTWWPAPAAPNSRPPISRAPRFR